MKQIHGLITKPSRYEQRIKKTKQKTNKTKQNEKKIKQ